MALSAQDNAYAERIHLTIKDEYLNHWNTKTFKDLKTNVKKAVKNYNLKRIHNELNDKTPTQIEELCLNSSIDLLPELTIFNNES